MKIVINGGGKIGEYLASTMQAKGHEVSVIEQDRRTLDKLVQNVPSSVLLIHGDGCDSEFQRDAGIESADIFVATTGADDVNLVSCEIASLVWGVPRAIARVSSPKNDRLFRLMGIEAVSSTTVISRLIEMEATEGAVHALLSLTQGDLVVTEMKLPEPKGARSNARKHIFKNAANAAEAGASTAIGPAEAGASKGAVGRRVTDIAGLLPAESLLVAVGDGVNLSIVNGNTVLKPGDSLIVVSKQGLENRIRDTLGKLW